MNKNNLLLSTFWLYIVMFIIALWTNNIYHSILYLGVIIASTMFIIKDKDYIFDESSIFKI